MIRQQLSKPIHLVLINKFGKLEAEGGGLRDVIAEAYLLGIPTLIGIPLRNLSVDLPPFHRAIRQLRFELI